MNKKILVTGSAGFLGKCLLKILLRKRFHVVGSNKRNFNLLSLRETIKLFEKEKPQVVFHCAGKTGGLKYNMDKPAEIYHHNLIMTSNIFETCAKFNIKKLILVGSSCMYPKTIIKNYRENDLFFGPLHESSEATGFWKLAMVIGMKVYKKEHKLNSICAALPSIFGPSDDFSLENSHFIGALVKKFVDAKQKNKKIINCWGSGKEIRDCIFVNDAAEGLIKVMQKNLKVNMLNICTGKGLTINKYAELIKKISGFRGNVKWDRSKPLGIKKKVLDNKNMKKYLKWSPPTNIVLGLTKTINSYKKIKIS